MVDPLKSTASFPKFHITTSFDLSKAKIYDGHDSSDDDCPLSGGLSSKNLIGGPKSASSESDS